MAQCSYKTEKNRQCKLEAHDDNTKHKMVLPRKPLSEVIPAGFKIQPTDSKSTIRKQSGRGAGERTTEQKRVDQYAVDAYQKWEKAGKPSFKDIEKRKSYTKDLVIPPAALAIVVGLFNNATGVHGSLPGKVFRYTKGQHESGNLIMQYTVMDREPKK